MISSNQQTEECQKVPGKCSQAPRPDSPTKKNSTACTPLWEVRLYPEPQKRDCREGTKVREESKRPSGDSWVSSGTNRQAFAIRHSHQRVLYWQQWGLSSQGAWLAFKGAGSLGPRRFTAVKASCAFPLRQAFHRKENTSLQLFIMNRKSCGDILPPLTHVVPTHWLNLYASDLLGPTSSLPRVKCYGKVQITILPPISPSGQRLYERKSPAPWIF